MEGIVFIWIVLALPMRPTAECSPGRFGWRCRFRCNCEDQQPCDERTGECTSGCPSGHWGKGCLLDNDCAYNDKFYEHYVGHKSRTEGGDMCHYWTNQTEYSDNSFPEGSREAAKNFCRNPQVPDSRSWCNYLDGNQTKWKYCTLEQCDCPVGLYGINCQHECHCQNPEKVCHQTEGRCLSGCDIHWTGTDCQEMVGFSTTEMVNDDLLTTAVTEQDHRNSPGGAIDQAFSSGTLLHASVRVTSLAAAIVVAILC